MRRTLLLLLAALLGVVAVGCGDGSAPLADTPSAPRPAPGAATKDVMLPSAKTGQ